MKKTIIIAEAGVNHNGSLELAKQLIAVAADSGADYVKFQTFNAAKLVSKFAKKADYQIRNIKESSDDSQLAMLNKLQLSVKEHYELIEYCKTKGIAFFSTAFDLDSIDFLNSLGMAMWKVPSGEITNFPYLRAIGKTKKPVILSTGMSEIQEIENAITVLTTFGTPQENITLLHCTTEYPAPIDEVNLNAIKTMHEHFGLDVGYSDHTLGIEVPIAAVALGATIIEKHFTLNKTMQGPDHAASLEPEELKQMVKSIRNVEQALGSGIKTVAESERKNIAIARKSIVATYDIKKGDIFTETNLSVKRPANGINPMRWVEVLGQVAIRDFKEDEPIEL